ncbi:DMT family transporter [Stutzerimonas stutzeri]|jgi:drug/metabolite transporter (DMT)-like permease|uniref:EamA family transporter n=1 Tax=Stutzerimonas stutzeri TaxID=316 RepID=A0A2N8RCV5_STUST|nr:DMT family transporter [Stutzerimonas stutzeri]MCQ4254704.1 DMT family transporter [Stutzerimonas stutzeri]PNF58911.1 EamA family transporter [Stutzerimonas stutzeri]
MKQGVIYGSLAGASWGLVFLSPALLPDFSPLLLSCGRFLMYGVIALLVGLPVARGLLHKLTMADLLTLTRLSLSGNIVYFMLLAAAVQRVGIAPTSLIIGVLPLTITLLGRNEADAPPLSRLLWPLSMVLAGIVCINLEALLGEGSQSKSHGDRVLGMVYAMLALACWSWFATDNARCLKRQKHFNSNEWSLLTGVVTGVLAGCMWLAAHMIGHPAARVELPAAHWQAFWLVNLALAVLASWMGYTFWNASTRRLPLTLSGQMVVFETLFALVYGFVYLQRLPTALEGISIALLLGGVCAAVARHSQPTLAAPANLS